MHSEGYTYICNVIDCVRDRVVAKLEHLYKDDDSPRKWTGCVIYYSSDCEKRETDIDDAKINRQ